VFSEQGFSGTSLDAIAKQANCTKGLVVHYFGGKQQLWQAVIDYYVSLAEGSEFINQNSTLDMPGIELFLRRTFRFFQTHPDYTQIADWIAVDNSVGIPPEMSRLLQGAGEAFSQTQQAGALREDVDARHAHLLAYSLIASWFRYRTLFQQAWQLDPAQSQDQGDAYFNDILKILIRGLAPVAGE
jgi:TetR/AcrR family transcriptional regulator